MRLGWHGATTMTSDLEMDVAVAAKAGFTGLELWATKVDLFLTSHSVDELRDLLDSRTVAPFAINSIEFIAFRGAEFSMIRDRCLELSRIAAAVGCPTVVVVPSPTVDREMPWSAVVREYVRVLRELAAIAGDLGVRLAFEFLGFGWCSVRTPRAALEIIRATDRDNVGLVLDAAHFYAGGGLVEEIDPIDPRQILAFHLDDLEDLPKEAITDAVRLMPGEGVVPLAALCARLAAIGYDGPCSIELFRPEYWHWEPIRLATAARAAAISVLAPHFRLE